ncbi:hypothetical protein SA496_07600 [Pseudomonas sp. JS3066]|uniref:hypothetical protein n=1 Tax=unclassified Pseudomonas TaxID=196821 RepID=UPI000EA9C867|nr:MULTISPECIES: hypothetical protein [unclassified Pseudomonas]AYF87464.1 hypothetical protein D6Z43_09985 [Pseudomonas sp. DY-1]MDH4656651.1 hypothetical protein [Pseudomonas sp. BN606]MRK23049.1 hypothetical protein [Pseudomonas sp. JG-B]WVK95026.1 hypothetical protein SA496_07600 [Pseudomonas sp. JS3066]
MNSLVPVLAALTLAATAVFAASEAIMSPALQPAPDAIGELLVSRDENTPNACDIDLYVQNELVAKIAPGQSVSIPVPAGEVALRVAQNGAGYCSGLLAGDPQSAIFQPGEVRHFRIVQNQHEVLLAPAAD